MPKSPFPSVHKASVFTSMKGNHVAIRIADYEASKRWFTEKLEFRVIQEWTDMGLKFAYLAPAMDDHFLIEIIGGGKPILKPYYSTLDSSMVQAGYHHFSLTVNSVDDTIAELRRRGVRIVGEPFEVAEIARRLAFISDPWGNLIELVQLLNRQSVHNQAAIQPAESSPHPRRFRWPWR